MTTTIRTACGCGPTNGACADHKAQSSLVVVGSGRWAEQPSSGELLNLSLGRALTA